MKKYLIVQLKSVLRFLPAMLVVMALLLTGISLLYQGFSDALAADNTRICVGIVGSGEDAMLQMAISAVESMDSSRFTLEFLQMNEQQAQSALRQGNVDAYILFPENFLQNALHGKIHPLQFVCTSGSQDVVSLVKEELTSALADVLMISEYGAFALGDVLEQYGYQEAVGTQMNEISLAFASMLIQRESMYRVEELGVSAGLDTQTFLVSGLTVLVLLLMTVPAAPVFIREDISLQQLLQSRGIHPAKQCLCEFLALFLLLVTLFVVPLSVLAGSLTAFLGFLPVIFALCAISFLIYSIFTDIITGVWMQITVSVLLCYVCGCIYPIHFFPLEVQNAAGYLPAAVARLQVAAVMTGQRTSVYGFALLGIGVVCLLAAILVRWWRLKAGRGAGR